MQFFCYQVLDILKDIILFLALSLLPDWICTLPDIRRDDKLSLRIHLIIFFFIASTMETENLEVLYLRH